MLKKQKTPPPRLINQKREEEEEEEKSRRAVPINPGTHTQRTQITQGTHTHTRTLGQAGENKHKKKNSFCIIFFFQVLFTYG